MYVSKGVMSSSKAYVSRACFQALLPETATPAARDAGQNASTPASLSLCVASHSRD